jgi:tetratricopeptide (TPR) repeat protein
MPRQYLFGPVSDAYAEQHLWQQWPGQACKVFDCAPGTDLVVRPDDNWETLLRRLPGGWRPEFLVLHLQYRTVSPWLFQAPVPVITLAGDGNLQWHAYRQLAGCCDAILTDRESVERFARAGISHARPAILFGGERDMLEGAWPEVARDIDLLFVGNFQADVQRERLPLVARLAQLRPRLNVVLATNVYGEEYRKLLARSRIVFNRGIRGEWNTRVCEALAAGALLFQEAGNREVFGALEDRKECVAYTPDDLIPLLQHFLEHEDERRAIAEAGRARVQEFSFGRFWQNALDTIEQDWEALVVHVDQVRLFPNNPGLRWRYHVHEQILLSLRALGASVQPTRITIEHVGFAEAARQGAKVERNWRLLQLELQEHPDDTFVLYNLGAVAMTQDRLAEALTYLQKCIEKSEPGDNLLPKVYSLVTRCRHAEGRKDLAAEICRQGRMLFPQDAELLFSEAVLLHE